MNEREIEAAIKAIDFRIERSEGAVFTSGVLTSEQRRDLYGARDALEIELRNVRAGRR